MQKFIKEYISNRYLSGKILISLLLNNKFFTKIQIQFPVGVQNFVSRPTESETHL